MVLCWQMTVILIPKLAARIDSHMIGKQHTGYLRIRRTVEEFGVSWFLNLASVIEIKTEKGVM